MTDVTFRGDHERYFDTEMKKHNDTEFWTTVGQSSLSPVLGEPDYFGLSMSKMLAYCTHPAYVDVVSGIIYALSADDDMSASEAEGDDITLYNAMLAEGLYPDDYDGDDE